MVGENFEIHHPQMVETTLLFVHHSYLFEIHQPQMAETALLIVNHGWNIYLKFIILKRLRLHFSIRHNFC